MHEKKRQMSTGQDPRRTKSLEKNGGTFVSEGCPCCPSLRDGELEAEHLLVVPSGPGSIGQMSQSSFSASLRGA